ncbi:hypothetical protein WJX77_001385 [Trebouxia sp. C0004]
MSDFVQTNLHRLISKSQKRRSAGNEDEPCPVLKRPSLLRRLADSDEDASCTVSVSNAQAAASTQPYRPGPLQPLQTSTRRPNAMRKAESSHQPQHSKVMVLGGTRSDIQANVSHGRRSKRCQIRAFNHYSNGGGTWDSDMVGLDGMIEPDSTWEGRGVISLGR